MSREYMDVNRKSWNDRVAVHMRSDFYDVDAFKNGACTLKSVELEELGDVAGKSLLHLQCHFGLDTLSLARLGAEVTGVDFSSQAIIQARRLSQEMNLPAKFICCDMDDLSETLAEQFDIVFTSYGVLCWLPDLKPWATLIESFLNPGGRFYIVEHHNLLGVFDNREDASELSISKTYFHSEIPVAYEDRGTYACRDDKTLYKGYEWRHGIGDVISVLSRAGLHIDFLNEFPYTSWQALPFLEQGRDGWWGLPSKIPELPLMFSLQARKLG